MDKLTWEELPNLFDAALGFLRADHGFHPSDCHIGELSFGRYYFRQRVGIQVSLDRRDRCLNSYLLRLSAGQLPDGWAVDSAGRVCRLRLSEALRSRCTPLVGVPIPPGTPPPAALSLQLQWVARHLRENLADILSDSDDVFLGFNRPT